MYSDASILALVNRIGFGVPSDDLTINIDEDNQVGSSLRTFSYFHKLCTIENIYATTNEIDMDEVDFNSYLAQLKLDSVKAVLAAILNKNKSYLNGFDYSDTIITKPELFDDAVGYSVATSAIEQMLSTTRANLEERNASATYEKLKIELEGAKNENGYSIAYGLKSNLNNAVGIATKIIFPEPLTISNANVW